MRKGSPFGGNGDDRRQRRKQGGAVGAAASRMQATAKQTLGAATRPWRVAPERARPLTRNHRRSDSIALTKGLHPDEFPLIMYNFFEMRYTINQVVYPEMNEKNR